MTPEPLLTVDEVARVLALTPAHVRDLARRGSLPHYRLGRRLRFRVAELEAWLADQRRDRPASGPTAPRNPASRPVSRRRDPTVTPAGALYPEARRV